MTGCHCVYRREDGDVRAVEGSCDEDLIISKIIREHSFQLRRSTSIWGFHKID